MMAAQGGEDVYASLLLTDEYLPGALVLAHSLRDAGTTKKLAILVTLDTVSAEVVTQLKALYDYVIPVPRIRNDKAANLYLMNRPDLHSAFTKINLWRQTQFRKMVYLDADVVAYRAPDELFALPHAFSAAPDIGWPDLFNTGVMVLTPDMGEYYALKAMADRGISFDGADQGLLNMHFRNTYNRLSFTYNVTPSAHYQYVPAYKHFQSSINMVHFIGSEKPWVLGRDKTIGNSPFDEIAGRWWAVYDRHYRKEVTYSQPQQAVPELVQYFVKGEYQPRISYSVPVGEPSHDQSSAFHGQQYQPSRSSTPPPLHFDQQQHHHHHHQQNAYYPPSEHQHPAHQDAPAPAYYHSRSQHGQHHGQHHDQHHDQHYPQHHHHHENSQPSAQTSSHSVYPSSESFQTEETKHTEAQEGQASGHQQWAPQPTPPQPQPEHKPEPPVTQSWDAQRHPPPADSKPEAANFPATHYEMSSDPAPFVPPERYPSPPKNMWYEVPKEPPALSSEKPKAIFPWEMHQPRASRVFASQAEEQHGSSEAPSIVTSGEHHGSTESQPHAEPSVTESSTVEHRSEPQTPTQPSIPWTSFTRTNAWDDVPEISRYVDAIQKHRRTRSQGLGLVGVPKPSLSEDQSWGRRGSFKVTDFPSEDDRPSLPVTPAPIRRPKFWGGGDPSVGPGGEDDDEKLPTAEGVPAQSDWDPVAQLQKLAKQQSELLLQRLGGSAGTGLDGTVGTEGRELPSRPLPFGSEDAKSPTYVAPAARPTAVLSPKPVKPDSGTSSVRNILAAGDDVGGYGDDSHSHTTRTHVTGPIFSIPEPSYQGPGASFEKGEDIPTFETPALPTEEDRDVLET
ncbi:family 8 glycosyl transferase [Apodospora peruviana]|uniref:glycogenin glucosyltransferase n=1 Tax=Apodospora peruviana TaxID=516989 RepID=A0AAE0IHV0_9PEZI|nr:family 8 glycosyl transferase [Apodospora peruviana]